MEIDLSPRYRNYWLDLARDEKIKTEEEKKKEAILALISAITNIQNNKKP